MPQHIILNELRRAFPHADGALRTYLNAYAAYLHAGVETRKTALAANLAAWRALGEAEREAIDDVLQSVSVQVV